jgi:IclR family KDG regulon transcriptional repressor
MLQTLKRAGRVLDLFDAQHREWGATGVARELGIAKSQAHELLASLGDIGLLQRTGNGRYRLGWRIAMLNSLLWDASGFRREIAGEIRTLAGRYGETLQVAVWDGERAVCVAGREGTRARAVSPTPVGMGLPAHCTGVGKVLLASRPPDEIRDALARARVTGLERRTVAVGDGLHEELEAVRRRGFAYEHGEHSPERSSVAAPIVRSDGEVLAALGMVVPAHRWPVRRDEYTRALVASASRVSRRVAHPMPAGASYASARPPAGGLRRRAFAIAEPPSREA